VWDTGPFEAVQGHSYIHVLIENMTGYLDPATCRMATGDAIVKMLKAYCLRYGFPRVIHTDRGLHFNNHECLDWAKENGLRWVFAGPRTVKTHGKGERAIRSIKRNIAKLANQDPKASRQQTGPHIAVGMQAG